ncbi:hypothetical protein M0802_000469 [Mischocyttarus mexicanus]|nr:hypothetical protein M0802_000469 [Mischocyttarus mexicanus]
MDLGKIYPSKERITTASKGCDVKAKASHLLLQLVASDRRPRLRRDTIKWNFIKWNHLEFARAFEIASHKPPTLGIRKGGGGSSQERSGELSDYEPDWPPRDETAAFILSTAARDGTSAQGGFSYLFVFVAVPTAAALLRV